MKSFLLFERVKTFYRKYGFKETLRRFLARITLKNRQVFSYVDLEAMGQAIVPLISELELAEYAGEKDISQKDMERLIELIGKENTKYRIKNGFSRKAVLWCLKLDGIIVSTCWSIASNPIQRLPLPLMKRDVHIFDVETYPEHKGQGLAPMLINAVLERLGQYGFSRAYIATEVWNKAFLSCLRKTYFQEIGVARTFYVLGRDVAIWRSTGKPSVQNESVPYPAHAKLHK